MSDKVFQIRWRKGSPYIAIGHVVETGKTRKRLHVKEPDKKTLQRLVDWSTTIDGAINNEIKLWADRASPLAHIISKYGPDVHPRDLEETMCRLRRFRRKLQRYRIIE